MATAKPDDTLHPPQLVASGEATPAPVILHPNDSRVRSLCEILSRTQTTELERAFSSCGIIPVPELVEAVLCLSYSYPSSAVQFFRWSGLSLKHTPRAWNLMIDILGRNGLFDAMWDAIRSMKQEGGILSAATFASAFGSYCAAGKIKEAIMTFDVMDRYGVSQDVVAVNSLLSAICRQDGRTADAADFFDRIKARVPPDADTFAILFEGWEKEGNTARAKTTFGEMIIRVGWNANNMSAYDAFLSTLVRAAQPQEALKFLMVMKSNNCLPGLKFFSNALDILVKHNDSDHALALWDIMVTDSGLVPDLVMFNAMISLLCNNQKIDFAFRYLDDMPFYGAFPDSRTYNAIFECLIRNNRAREAELFFREMKKNELPPTPSNCAAAIRMFFDQFDPAAALDVWSYLMEELMTPDNESANELLLGLAEFGRLSFVARYAEDMLDRGIELRLTVIEKLKNFFQKAGKPDLYDRITRKMNRQ
ncbi:pentatricopeptide repeat-containing protein At1g77360, mitochondrial [Dendrobium catenatum]|uniref:Pentatricopeptide repeat-containing protein n=1 Tax=Dendrobium catenatum TaxID=906689 RepID=A0A2I0VKC6_9ASPA|nr:pentatricopeptide repeat-containing protein At1g77360, mitochondrial [Dendrobium catenatum]XP_020697847.1 pentatricopeptide repeat-containing protein At1g77360, mitochondrial [Dendrobium catenatum]PKU63855.1 Pentatricopeptide repeat-containing protein [Dendrobium catenatum]